MFIFIKNNKMNLSLINRCYNKLKINNLFLIYDFIIFIKIEQIVFLKNKILNNDIFSLGLQNSIIKTIFKLPNYSFLKGGSFYCIFIKDIQNLINILNILKQKEFFYSFKHCLSNIVIGEIILKQYYKYNMNYIYIQFILKKLIIKIFLIIFFFLISLIKNIK